MLSKITLPDIQHGTRGLAGSIEWSLIALGSGIHRDLVHGVSGFGVLWLLLPFNTKLECTYARLSPLHFDTSGFCSLIYPILLPFSFMCACAWRKTDPPFST